jgi:hypothetical protein
VRCISARAREPRRRYLRDTEPLVLWRAEEQFAVGARTVLATCRPATVGWIGKWSRRSSAAATCFRRANDTLAKLRTAPHASGDAARPLPRLTIALAEVICNGRDAVANGSAEALQRRAKVSAVRQLQLVVSPPLLAHFGEPVVHCLREPRHLGFQFRYVTQRDEVHQFRFDVLINR